MFPKAPLPERIGSYAVLRRLPSSGGADRYLGREDGPRGFTRMVELKLAPAEEDPELGAELAHEASVVSQLNHPHISRMHHFFEYEGRLVLVLERLEGTTLARVLASSRRRRQRLPDEVVYYVAHRLVSAIAHAHGMKDDHEQRMPIVHRAISPAAIQLGWGGEVRLTGFGLAKIMGRSPDTAVGLVKGTPGYMAPEQLRGERITERTDIYQAGLVIWEMISGNPPSTAGTPQKSRQAELVMMMSGPELASVSVLRPSIPREIAAIIDAMLEPSVEKRKISAAEVERWLSKTVNVEGGKEMLRERAVAMRAQDVRDSSTSMEPMRMPAGTRRTTMQRREGGESSATFSLRRGVLRAGGEASSTSLTPAARPVTSVTPEPPSSTPKPPVAEPPAVVPPPVVPPQTGEPRVTMPDMEPPLAPLQEIPVEGDRGATTAISHSSSAQRLVPRTWIVIGVVSIAALVGLIAIGIRLASSTSESPPVASTPSSSSAPPTQEKSPLPVPEETSAPPNQVAAVLPPLNPKQGALLVKSEESGNVYLNGYLTGEVNQVLIVPCGTRFLRVGAPAPVAGRVQWLSRGFSTKIPCGVLTEVDAQGKLKCIQRYRQTFFFLDFRKTLGDWRSGVPVSPRQARMAGEIRLPRVHHRSIECARKIQTDS